jgi:REP element-mobilizing transposase RayT
VCADSRVESVCENRRWVLIGAHVRTNHVHVIVEADVSPEKVMNDLKSYASRELNRLGRDGAGRKRWARHGSTRWLWSDQDLRDAVCYVSEGQGDAMAVFVAEDLRD